MFLAAFVWNEVSFMLSWSRRRDRGIALIQMSQILNVLIAFSRFS